MRISFTRNFTLLLAIVFLGMLQLLTSQQSFAQGNSTPTIKINLTGQPNGEWDSRKDTRDVSRRGQVCGADKNENCIQFEIILDKDAGGLEFAIVSGPLPSGSMSYQVNCGTPVPVGQPICVEGVGPHIITLCMPGNAYNDYVIRSIAAFNPQGDVSVTGGCSAVLNAPIAFDPASITWRDITGGGLYNKYLSFPNGNANPLVTPDANAPAYVDYEVCGRSVASPCSTLPYCDVVRVYFYPAPVVSIGPTPAIICPGGSGVVLTGTVTGGDGKFDYVWKNAAGTVVGNAANYTATSVGTYTLEVKTKNNSVNCRNFSASVNVVSNLTVNAGPDQLVCSTSPVQLAGAVTAATGGIWSGGAGTFSSRTALNAVYTPTAAEINAGSVTLTLTSTGNGSCSPVQDQVVISFYTMNVSLSGTPVICNGTLGTVTATVTGGQGTISYLWNTGEKTATISNKPAGTYTVTVNDGKGCAVTKSFTVTQVYGPSDFAADVSSSTCGASNGTITVTGVTGGTRNYTYSKDGTNFQPSAAFTGLAAGTHTITVKDANGCTFAKTFTITNIAGPSAVTATAQPASCFNNDGSILVGAVTGGTEPYTYSINGTTFQDEITFAGLASGTYTVTVKDAKGCRVATSVAVVVNKPTNFASTPAASTCGNPNGSITVDAVTGGFAPYTYSKDGINFQTESTLTGFAAGTHTITVKDAKGCTFSRQVSVTNIAGPSDLTATIKASTCSSANGEISVVATGGTKDYTYSKDGVNFQSSAAFTGLLAGQHTITVKDAKGCTYAETFTITNIAGPTAVAATSNPASCLNNDGSITVGPVTGGTETYTYSINGTTFQTSTTFTGLAAGTYTVTVQDKNGCRVTTSVVVGTNVPTGFTATPASSTCSDSNGSITVSAPTGGTGTYTYSKDGVNFQTSPVFSGLLARTYTITIKDGKGCTFAKQVTVTDIAGPSDLVADVKATTCGNANGQLTLSSTGGTRPYSFSLNGGAFQTNATFTGLAAGTYAIRVKDDKGCIVSREVTINNIAGPTDITATLKASTCGNPNGEISVRVVGGTEAYQYSKDGVNFQDSPAFTGLAANTYTIRVKDANGCTFSKSFTLTNVAGPTAVTATSNPASCLNNDGSITVGAVTGGTQEYTYSLNGTTFQTGTAFTGLAAGTYTVTARDANGCRITTSVVVGTNVPTGFTATPASSTCGSPNGSISVSSVSGGTGSYRYSRDGVNFQDSPLFTDLAAQAYTITVKDAKGCTFAKQITVTNIAGPTAVSATANAASCADNNGSIIVGTVSGGTAPYTYSINGTSFQSGTSFTGLASGAYTVTAKDAKGCQVTTSVTVTKVMPTDFTATPVASTCGNANGSITISAVIGGTTAYTYSKDGGATYQTSAIFSNLAAATYTMVVKDARGCTVSKQVTVTNTPGPSDLTASVKSSTCGNRNGELTVGTVNGGREPYTYSINGTTYQSAATFTGLLAGEYQVRVKDANGCIFTEAVTIGNIAGPAVTATAQSSTCGASNGQIAVSVTGGTAPFSYSKDGGATYQTASVFSNLAAGTYNITVKDANNCVQTTSVALTNVAGPNGLNLASTSSTCGNPNGSIRIDGVTGGTSPYTYSINGGTSYQSETTFGALAARQYTVLVKDANGCTFSRTIAVANITGPTDFTATAKASTCGASNGEVTISNVAGSTATYTYSKDGENFQSSATFTGLLAGNYTFTVKDANGCTLTKQVTVSDIAGPSNFTATPDPTSCGRNDGSIVVSAVSGGTAPYSYSKDGGATYQTTSTFANLVAGTYQITVKDAKGCVFMKPVVLEDEAGPTDFNLAAASSTCGNLNGSITVGTVTGGKPTYTYSRNGSTFQTSATFTGLAAGAYTITVKDANGCTVAKQITVTNIAGPTNLTATTKASTCGAPNGELTITEVTGGTSDYTYSKDGVNFQASATFTGLLAGNHTITVKDANGCTFAKAFTISNIAGPTAVTASTQPTSCANNDGSITVGTVTGGTEPYTYSINGRAFQEEKVFTGVASGTYTVTAKDANGCVITRSVTVTRNVPIDFASTPTSSTCGNPNGSITVGVVTGGFAPYTYSRDGVNFQTDVTLTDFAAGTHTITVKDAKGCTFSKQVTVTNIAGPTDLVAVVTSSTCGGNNGAFTVSSVSGGKATYTYSIDGVTFQTSATFTALLAGEYQVRVKDANGCIYTEAVVVPDIAGPSFTATAQSSTCGNPNGSIAVSDVSGGVAPYSYSINGGAYQTSPTFTALAAATYHIAVKDANNCVLIKQVEVNNIAGPSDLALAGTSSSCGRSNGSIAVNGVTGGTAPYTYSINGTTFQTATSFGAVLAGEYTVTVKDAKGCVFSKKVVVEDVAGPTDMAATTRASTCGAPNGELTITTTTGGTSEYTYSKDGVNFQASATFTGLLAGAHTITVKDANGCTYAETFTITNIAGPTAVAASAVRASCLNNDGSITVGAVTGGTAPYTYSINATTFQEETAFTGLASGTYTVTAKDANGCMVTTSIVIGKNVPTNFASTSTSSTCGASNGSITVGAISGGTAPYTYSKDGVTFQTDALLTGFAAGTHTITVKDAKGCTFAKQITITNIAGPTDLVASIKASTCGDSNGELTITGVTGGTAPFTYSKDGVNFQSEATFTGLAAITHTITVKDANGCTFAKAVSLDNVAGPAFATVAQATTCGASNGHITVEQVTGGVAPYSYAINGGAHQASASFKALVAGNYTISVMDANGCVATARVDVRDIAGPSDLTLTSMASTCGSRNGSINVGAVTGGTAPYTYSINGTTFQAEAAFANVLAGEYTLTVKDANGCVFSKQVVVENIAGPTDLLATTTASTCGAPNGELTVTAVTGGTAPYMYSKDGVNFQASATFPALAAGSYTIRVKDANGCIVSKAVAVANIAGPSAVAATSQQATCADNDGSINVGAVTGGTEPYTYSINGTAFQSATAFAGLASGTYTVTAKDANGCMVTTTVAVGKNVATNFASTTTPSACGRSDGSITIGTVTGGAAPYTYSINGSAFQEESTFSGLAAGTHTITVKDANNCTFAKEVAVNNVAGPAFVATAKATTCGSNNGTITVSNTSGGVGPYTYSIDGVNFGSSTVFANLVAGTYTITVKDARGCLGTSAVTVEDIAGPSGLVLSAVSSTCGNPNASISIEEVIGGTAPYSYSKDGENFQESAAFTALAAGDYTITVKDDNGCVFSREVKVDNIAGPSGLTLSAQASTCGSNNGTIRVDGVSGGTAPYTFALDGITFQEEATFEAVLAGEYTITVKDANGCVFSKKVVVQNIAGPTDLAATTKASTCGAPNGELTVSAVTGGTSDYTYSKDGVNFQASATFTGLLAGTHTITVKDANGCIYAETVTITNIAGPSAVAAAPRPATCADNDGSINVGAVTGGTSPYTYSINGSDFQESTAFAWLASGNYTVTVKDANGCVVTTSVTVIKNVPTNFTATAVASTCGNSNGSITIRDVMGGTASYTFSKDGVNFQEAATLTGFAAGTHTITVMDANGCRFSKQVQVENIAGPSELVAAVKASTCGSNNGSFTISSVAGGTAPYTYAINNGSFQSDATFSSLLAGTYRVTVQDANGCTYTQEVTLEDIAGPSAFTAVPTASSCGRANGSITVETVVGGTAPYTYSVDGETFQASATLAGLTAGEYTITVKDANGCEVAMQVRLEDVAGPSGLQLATTSSTCSSNNGSIRVAGVTGGTAPYTYAINGTDFQTATSFEAVLAGEYTVIVKDANGCVFSKKVKVDNIAGPSDLVAAAKASTCGAANGELTITGVTGGTLDYTYSKDGVNFQASGTFAGLLAGQHTITVKDANGCIFSKVFTVADIAGPSAVAATAIAATCADNDGSITVGTVSGGTAPYTYSINGSAFQESTAFAGLASGAYTVTVKDANGCVVTTSVSVSKNGPASFASATVASSCGRANGSIAITSVTGGTAPYTYSLNGGAFQSEATFSGLVAGAYTITVKDANGCTHTQQVTLSDVAGPSDLVATAKGTTCGESNGEIAVTGVTGGTAPYTYSINGTTFQAATTFAALAAGEYQLRVKDANGCILTKAITVTNTSGPSGFALASQAATCGGSNGQVIVSKVTGGTAPYTYSKDGVSFQAAAMLTGFAAGNYTITVKDANGCTFTKTVVVENIAGPTGFEVTATKTTCGDSNGTVTVSSSTGGTAPYTYSIDGTTFQATGSFASLAAGAYAVTVKDANGCLFVKQVTVENLEGPSALSAATTPASCTTSNGTITIGAVVGGTAPYAYSLDGKTYQAAGTFTGLAPGKYDVYAKDANGCSTKATVTVGVKGPQDAVLASKAATCGQSNGSITISSVSGGTLPLAYSINGTTFQASSTFQNLAAGNYTVTIRDAEGCILTRKQDVQNNGGPESFTATGTNASCGQKNGSIVISQVSGGTAPYTYAIDGVSYQAAPEFRGLAEGTYQVSVKDAKGCIKLETVTIGNSAPITGLVASAAPAACGQATGQVVVDKVTGGTAPYTYSLDGKNFSAATTLTGVAPGSYTLTVKDARGCTYTTPVKVEQIAPVRATVTPLTKASATAATGSAKVTAVSGGTGPYTYQLNNGTFTSETVFNNLKGGTHKLVVKDSKGCTAEVSFTIETEAGVTPVEPVNPGNPENPVDPEVPGHELGDIEIPNGFTPNGDGINDRWVLKNLAELYPNCQVTVYNRWGSPVFESVGYRKEWDGTHNGKKLPDGTYYCIIEFGNEKAPLKRSVTIMR